MANSIGSSFMSQRSAVSPTNSTLPDFTQDIGTTIKQKAAKPSDAPDSPSDSPCIEIRTGDEVSYSSPLVSSQGVLTTFKTDSQCRAADAAAASPRPVAVGFANAKDYMNSRGIIPSPNMSIPAADDKK